MISQIMQFYILQEKPLDGMYIFHALEPLAGTSFMRVATEGLRYHVEERRPLTSKDIYPNDLLIVFFGMGDLDEVKEVKDAARQEEATIAMHSLLTYAIGLDQFLTKEWLEADEMMLYQTRWDDIYFDTERTRLAFTHTSLQWQFYKAGHYLHTLANSRIMYLDEEEKLHLHALMPDGFYDSRFFIDERRKTFTGLSSQQQVFQKGKRMLYISPHFSFDAARRQEKVTGQ